MSFKIDTFYIPKAVHERYEHYTRYENIFLGDHKEAFNPRLSLGSGEDDAMYIQEQFGTLISYTSADLLFGESITIQTEDSDIVDTFYEANPLFDRLLHEAGTACSYFGDIVIEMSLKDDEPKVQFIDPRHLTVVKDNNDQVTEYVLSFVFTHEGTMYVRQRIHKVGLIEHKLFRVDEQTEKEGAVRILTPVPFSEVDMDVPDEEATDVDEFLVKQVPNMKTISRMWGLSDYLGKESLMNQLNMLTSFATYILEKHSDPAIEVPEGTIDQNSLVYVRQQKAFQTNAETKGIPRYITWDGKLEALFEQRKHTIDMLALYSEIAPGLLGLNKDGAIPEAASAMRLKYARTLMKIARKQRYWEEAIQFIFRVSQKLKGDAPIDMRVEFGSSLPEDKVEYMEIKRAERDLGVKSNETLIREVLTKQGYTAEEIEAELERIANEVASTAPVAADIFAPETPPVQ